MKIVFNQKDTRGFIPAFSAAAGKAEKLLGQSAPLCVSLSLRGRAEMRALNKAARNIDKTTDVLSFPMLDLSDKKWTTDNGRWIINDNVLIASDYPYESEGGVIMLGDIVICPAVARAQNPDFDFEMRFLFVHGLLHLFGFDHMTEKDAAVMRNMEQKILSEK